MNRCDYVGSKLSKIKWRELFELVAIIKTVKRILESKTVGYLIVFPYNNSTSAKFSFLYFELILLVRILFEV